MPKTATVLPPGIQFVRNFQGIKELLLDNGLKVLLFRDPSQANLTVNITYLVGSRHEGRGEAGMAHLLEHMLFRGTKKLKDVKGALQDRGAQFNATTWYDRTNYFETLSASDENLEFALSLEADRMINSTILQSDLEAEMTVVRNEFEMGENNPVHVLHDQMMSVAYRWHNYGKSTIGNRSDIERVPAKTLKVFYENYYQPDNAVLIVAGLFDEKRAIELIIKHYGPIARPTRILDSTYTKEPAQDGPREVVLQRAGDMASAALAYHIPSATHEDHAAVKVFMDSICDEPGGLIYQELVETGRCSECFVMTYSLCEPGMAMCFARPVNNDQAKSVRDDLILLIEERAPSALGKEQVERIKVRLLKQIKQSMKDSKNLALKLSEAIACGDWRWFFWHKEQIEKVNLSDVTRVAKKYFIQSNRTSGIFTPQNQNERAEIDHVEELDSIMAQLKDDDSIGSGEEFVASVQNIESLVHRDQSAGRNFAFLPKKSRGQSIKAKLILRFGDEPSLRPFVNEFELMPAMLWRGTTELSYQQLRDKFDALMSSVSLDGACGQLSASINSERKYIASALETVGQMFSKPAFDEKEFAIVRQREIDDLEEVKNDPQRLGFLELERLKQPWPKDHIHYVPSFAEKLSSLRQVTLGNMKQAFEGLVNLNNLSLAMVGDADGEGIKKLLPQAFVANLKMPPYKRVSTPFIKNKAVEVLCDTKDKEMAIVAMAFNFAMRDDHEDYAALKLANYMFGENMNSRLMNRIREREGISYGAGSFIEVSRFEEAASFSMYAMAAPASVSRAKAAMKEEFEKIIVSGVQAQELALAKESIRLSFDNLLASDSYLANALANDFEVNRNFFWREQLFDRINKLSAEQVLAVMKKWWAGAEFSQVCAGDQDKMA